MNQVTALLDGNKTYIAAVLGAAVILANHAGIHIPGVQLNPNDWLNQLWDVVLLVTGRSALKKVETK